MREVVSVHVDHGEDVPGDLLHRRRSHCTGEANESRRGNIHARLKQKSKEQCPGSRTHLTGHGGLPRRKFSPLPHHWKEAHRDDSNRKLTTLAILVHDELERDGLHSANLVGDGVWLNGVDGGENTN